MVCERREFLELHWLSQEELCDKCLEFMGFQNEEKRYVDEKFEKPSHSQ